MSVDVRADRERIEGSRDWDSADALAALRRASIAARKRAIEVSGSVAIYNRDGEAAYWTTVPELSEEDSHSD